uniref:NAD-dependent epimerase/dehydratase domain-containing protein n=1 Tax=Plectus sambesii TaxID=2011161 RepID=A0A914WAP5_9BILA
MRTSHPRLLASALGFVQPTKFASSSLVTSRAFSSDYGVSDPLTGCDRPRILITGALGQLGKGLAALIRSTYGKENVIMSDVVKPPRRLWTQFAPYLYLDVLDASNLEAAVVNYHVDWIIHLSAVLSAVGEQNVPLALRINCQGLQNVLEVSNRLITLMAEFCDGEGSGCRNTPSARSPSWRCSDSWPESLDDSGANKDWGWKARYNLPETVDIMFRLLKAEQPGAVKGVKKDIPVDPVIKGMYGN